MDVIAKINGSLVIVMIFLLQNILAGTIVGLVVVFVGRQNSKPMLVFQGGKRGFFSLEQVTDHVIGTTATFHVLECTVLELTIFQGLVKFAAPGKYDPGDAQLLIAQTHTIHQAQSTQGGVIVLVDGQQARLEFETALGVGIVTGFLGAPGNVGCDVMDVHGFTVEFQSPHGNFRVFQVFFVEVKNTFAASVFNL